MGRLKEGIQILQQEGVVPFTARSSMYLGRPVWNTITSRYPLGTNIFDRDWDLLIILDSCRVDALDALDITWINKIEHMQSVGSMSAEWMLNTFKEEYRGVIAGTALVSGNIWSHRILNERFHKHGNHEYEHIHKGWPGWRPVSSDALFHCETVSAIHNQDDRLHPQNPAIPHILTDRAIAVGRKIDFERLIVHYTLPHLPFIADALDWDPGTTPMGKLMQGPDPVRRLQPSERSYKPARKREVSPEVIRASYLNNLHLGIKYVEVLLENIDADKTIISSDHGEAFGEKGVWGHPYGFPCSPVKTVPWAKTTATDEKTYDPRHERFEHMPTKQESQNILKDLGYL